MTDEPEPIIAVAGNAVYTITPVPGGVVYFTPEAKVKGAVIRYTAAGPVNLPVWYPGVTNASNLLPAGGVFSWGLTREAFASHLVRYEKLLADTVKSEKDPAKLEKIQKALDQLSAEVKKLTPAEKLEAEAAQKQAPAPAAPAPAPAPAKAAGIDELFK